MYCVYSCCVFFVFCTAYKSPNTVQYKANVPFEINCTDKDEITTTLSENLKDLQCAQNKTCTVNVIPSECLNAGDNQLNITVEITSAFDATTSLDLPEFYENNVGMYTVFFYLRFMHEVDRY